uniref:Ankyrin repeat-containing protein BDA1-like n=1 Tax=Nelumbo nucifera TaxID=4432 RepID=A0A822XS29_NELNU|nr:TPA_asm: hypothetical protein HUJ06_023352 [Nelumbo nucifera]
MQLPESKSKNKRMEEGLPESMKTERQLREAALQGNAESMSDLLEKDNLILDRVVVGCIRESPLHIAATLGHVDFVKLLLSRKPELARLKDLRGHTPLHLAAARGHLEIVKALLDQDSGPGLCHARDTNGMIAALHLAAIEGQVDAIKDLVMEKPRTILQLVGRGETILHLCVKYGGLNVLEQLLDLMSNPDKSVNVGDANGNTTVSEFLNFSVADKQVEMNHRPNPSMITVWQDDVPGDPLTTNPSLHQAGMAILAYKNGAKFRRLFHCNTTGIAASLSIISLLD